MSGTTGTTYRVRWRVSGTTTWSVWSAPTSNWSDTINGLAPNTTYDVQVLATNPQGDVTSSIVQVTTSANAPGAMAAPVVSNVTYNSLVMNWTPPTTGTPPFTYQPQLSTDGGSTWTNVGTSTGNLSATVTGLAASTNYDFRIVATNSIGSTDSLSVAVTTAASGIPPTAPSSLTLSNIAATSLTLNWHASSGSATITYQPKYRLHNTTNWTNAGAATTGTSVGIAGLTAATSYDFQVDAINSFGTASSGILTGSTAAAVVLPSAPGTPVASAISSVGLALSWAASTGTAPISYQVQYKLHTSTTWLNSGGSQTNTTASVSGLSPATQYDFRVTATNSAGTATSGTTTVTTAAAQTPPSAPTGLSFTSVSTTGLNFSWTGSSGTAPINYAPQYRAVGALTTISASAAYYQEASQPAWWALQNDWDAGQLQAGETYSETITVDPAKFPNGTVIEWSWPNRVNSDGVWGYPEIIYGAQDGAVWTSPDGLGPAPIQINALTALTGTFDLTMGGNSDLYDVLWENHLTDVNGNELCEFSIMLHQPSYVKQWLSGLTNHYAYTAGGGISAGTVYVTTNGTVPYIIVAPTTDILSGTIDIRAVLNFLISKGTLTGNEYIQGFELGAEPSQGAGSLTINSLSYNWNGTTVGRTGTGSTEPVWTTMPNQTTTSVAVSGLAASTTYEFQVKASNASGSALSEPATVTTPSGSTTWSATDKSSNVVLSNGNMTAATNSTARGGVRATSSKNSGKQYLELTLAYTSSTGAMAILADPASNNTQIRGEATTGQLLTSEPASNHPYVGFANSAFVLSGALGATANGVGIDGNGDVWVNNVKVGSSGLVLGNGTLRVAIDFTTTPPNLWFALGSGAWSNSSAAAATGPSGSQNTGTTDPVISGPASFTVAGGVKTAISGVTVTDSTWPHAGTNALNVSCTNGTVWMSLNGASVAGSGTNSIQVSPTDSDLQSMIATLTYGAPTSGSDTIVVDIWDESGNENTLNIPITIATAVTANPSTGAGGIPLTGLAAGPYLPAYSDSAASGDSVAANFGATTLGYGVPTGFASWDALNTGSAVAPGPVATPAVSNIQASSVTLTWTAPTTGTTPFTYQPQYRKTGASVWTPFGNAFSGNTSINITGLTAGTGYDFSVIVSNSAGSSTSPSVSATTASASSGVGQVTGSQNTGTSNPVISGPISGTAQVSSQLAVTGITLSDTTWPHGGNDALNVSCSLGTVTMTVGGSPVTGSGTTSIAYSGTDSQVQEAAASLLYTAPATPGNDTILVNVWDQAGSQNTLSIGVQVVNNPGAPGTFTLTPGNATQTSIALSWNAPTGNTPMTYAVQYRIQGASTWTTFASTSNTTSTVTGLTASTTYEFRIQASNSIGTSTSNTAAVNTLNPSTNLPGDANGTLATRIAAIEVFGVNCFPSGQDGASASGTNSAAAHITCFQYIVGNSGLGMFNRIYANSTGLDEPWITSICQSLPNMKWTSCLNYSTSSLPVVQSEAQSTLVSNGYLIAIEGYNEPDNGNVQAGGTAIPVATCLSGQQTIYGTGHPAGLTVMLPSITDDGSNTYETDYMGGNFNTFMANADWCNGHMYLNSGPPNNTNFQRQAEYLKQVTSKPVALTEFHPLLYNNAAAQALGEQGAAYFTLIALLSGIADHGIKALQWFCMYDYTVFNPKVGLFRGFDPNNPTLTAMALKALFQLTGDAGGNARHTFQPSGLKITPTGLPGAASFSPLSGGRYIVFQNSAGKFFVPIWNEQQAPGGTASPVTFTFSGARTKVVRYNLSADPTNAMTPLQTLTAPNSASISFNLAAEVHLLVIDY